MMDSQKKCHRLLYLFPALTSEAPFNCKTLCFTYYPSLVFTGDAGESVWWEIQTTNKWHLPSMAQIHLKQKLAPGPVLFSQGRIFEGDVICLILSGKQVDVELCFLLKALMVTGGNLVKGCLYCSSSQHLFYQQRV